MTRAARSTTVTTRSYGINTLSCARATSSVSPCGSSYTVETVPMRSPDSNSTRIPVNSWRYTSPASRGRSSSAGARKYRSRHASARSRSVISVKWMMYPPLNGVDDSMRSVGRPLAGSPDAVPATRRRPTENTASASSVIGSTTRSPRMPCAFRTRPTMISSGATSLIRRRLSRGARHATPQPRTRSAERPWRCACDQCAARAAP